jgi:hypothetical protein
MIMLPVDPLLRSELLQYLPVLQGDSSVGIDEKGHKRGHQNVNNENRVDQNERKGTVQIIIAHVLEVYQSHVKE